MKILKIILTLLLVSLSMLNLKAETFKAGSYIINMGVTPQTYGNGLKPYGMVYDMVINHEVPLYWIIKPGKQLFGTDFTYGGVDYKAGSLVLPAVYVTPAVETAIADWKAKGVIIDGPTATDFDAPVFNYISSFPNAVLDQQNAKLTIDLFYAPADIPSTYYTTGTPDNITVCCDVYALPHADPQKWTAAQIQKYINYTDSKAQSFLWQGCHSVGAVEAHSANALVTLDITTDATIKVKDQNGCKIENDFPDINIANVVHIWAKRFELGENITMNISSGAHLYIHVEEKTTDCTVCEDGCIESTKKCEDACKKDNNCGKDKKCKDACKKECAALPICENNCQDTCPDPDSTEADFTLGNGSIINGDYTVTTDGAESGDVSNGDIGDITETLTIDSDQQYDQFILEDVSGENTDDPGYLNLFMLTTNGQISWKDDIDYEFKNDNSPAFQYDMSSGDHPIMQIAGKMDDGSNSAFDGGSQEIYIPRPDSAWRDTTTVAVWDPSNVNHGLNGGNTNKAALIAFGRTYGDPNNGILVQHASHTAKHSGKTSHNVNSGRIYGNLLLQASIEKRPIVTIHTPNQISYPNEYNMTATVERGVAPYDFDWDITCPSSAVVPGIFTPSTQNAVLKSEVIFKPNNNTLANCILRVKVTDHCGRKNFATKFIGISGYHPPLGYYNITHTGEDFSSSGGNDPLDTTHPVNSLYTQISGKPFDVMMVALDENKITPIPKNGNVILELINTAGITELKPESCAEASVYSDETSKIPLNVANGAHFNNTTTVNASGISYPNAIKDIGFRISYYDLALPAGDTYAYGIPTSMTKAELDSQFPSCESSCSATRTDWGCYQCISKSAYTGGYGKSVCARDNFAVRPASFNLNLTGTAPLIGGKTYPLQIDAATFSGNIDTWYTESLDDNGSLFSPIEEANITSVLTIPSGCSFVESKPELLENADIIFTSGVSSAADGSNFLFNYNNVGEVNITAVETKWVSTADMDKDYAGTSYERNDCIVGSSSNIPVNGKIGCMIMGKYTAAFIPFGFRNTLSVDEYNTANNFTYIANSDISNPNYGAKAELTFTAIIEDDTPSSIYDNPRAGNYIAGCYANAVSTTILLRNDTALTADWNSRWGDPQGRIWLYDNNSTSALQNAVPATFNYPETIFAANNGENNGTAKVEILFNFDRQINTPENPFRVEYTDFNITNVNDTVNTSVVGSDFNRTAGNSNESNASFYYARTKSFQFLYDDIETSSVNTPISVVVYCDKFPTCSEFNSDLKKINEPYWWLSKDHNETNGDGNIALLVGDITPSSGSATVDTDVTIVSEGSDESINVTKTNSVVPLLVEIDLDTSSNTTTNKWLIYNKNNSITDPDPFYKVQFIGTSTSAGWAGYGKTGNVVDSDANRKKLKRLEW